MSGIPLFRVAGRFYRAIRADRIDYVLDLPLPDSAGRYHRHGQPALYITPEPDWAVIAVGRYQREDGIARVVIPLDLSEAWVFDQRDADACRALGIDPAQSGIRWQAELAAGREPPSWRNAGAARDAGADGIIDPSRGIVGGWHVALFRWNVDDAPHARVAGPPMTIAFEDARSRWPSPPGWALGQG